MLRPILASVGVGRFSRVRGGAYTPAVADWHPIMAAVEGPPAHWRMIDTLGREYARIELRRTEQGPRYRVEIDGQVYGWAATLRVACEQSHRRYLDSHTPRRRSYSA